MASSMRASGIAGPFSASDARAVQVDRVHEPLWSNAPTNLSTYFAMTSTSRLTSEPTTRSFSVVTSRVCGIRATWNDVQTDLDDRERHSVDRDRSLRNEVSEHLLGRLEPDAADTLEVLDSNHRSGVVDVSLHQVPADTVREAARPAPG